MMTDPEGTTAQGIYHTMQENTERLASITNEGKLVHYHETYNSFTKKSDGRLKLWGSQATERIVDVMRCEYSN